MEDWVKKVEESVTSLFETINLDLGKLMITMESNELKIGEHEGRIDNLEDKINSLIKITQSNHELLSTIAKFADDNFEKLEGKLGDMQKTLNTLSKNTSSNFEGVIIQLNSIEGELKKINTATGYEEQYNNLKIVSKD